LVGLLDDPRAVGDVFNIGGEQEISILAVAARIKELARSDSRISVISYDDAYGAGFDDMQRRVPDTTKLRRLLGWAPAHTLDDILTETIAEARAERAEQLALAGE
jgi:UDP-glucose 4-epimerase